MSTYLEFDYITKNTFYGLAVAVVLMIIIAAVAMLNINSEVAVVLMIIIAAVAMLNINSEVATTINIDLQPQLNTGI